MWAETDEYTTLDKKLGGARIRVEQNPPSPRPAIDLRLHPGCGYDVGIFDASGNRPIQNATISFGWTDMIALTRPAPTASQRSATLASTTGTSSSVQTDTRPFSRNL